MVKLSNTRDIIIGILVVVVLFFIIFPELARVTGTISPSDLYVLGILIIIGLLVSLMKR